MAGYEQISVSQKKDMYSEEKCPGFDQRRLTCYQCQQYNQKLKELLLRSWASTIVK
jgi:hypothetical protein